MFKRALSGFICIAFFICLLSACGNITDDSPAIKVGETTVSLKEFRFYYKNHIEAFKKQYASHLQSTNEIDFSKPLYKQSYSGDATKTWADYFAEYTVNSFKNYCVLAEDARANGETLSDEDLLLVEEQVENVKKYLSSLGKTDEEYFGTGMTIDDYRETLMRNLLGTNRYYEYIDTLSFTEEECVDYARSKAENYYVLSYYWYEFKAADYNASYHEATHAAEDFAELLSGYSGDIEKLIYDHALTEGEKESYYVGKYTDNDVPFNNLIRDAQAWGYLDTRSPGDYIIATGTDGILLIIFKSLDLPKTATYNFRSIFVDAESNDFEGSLSLKKAREDAESIAAEFENGGGTEELFASLAKTYSDDSSASGKGGLYENNEFTGLGDGSYEWMSSSERKYGDIGIFDSTGGSYIIYYIGEGQPVWRVKCENALKGTEFNEHIEELANKYHFKTYKNVIEKVEKEQ